MVTGKVNKKHFVQVIAMQFVVGTQCNDNPSVGERIEYLIWWKACQSTSCFDVDVVVLNVIVLFSNQVQNIPFR